MWPRTYSSREASLSGRRDGSRQFVTLAPEPDYSWHVSLPVPATEVYGVALVDDGTIHCSARFDMRS